MHTMYYFTSLMAVVLDENPFACDHEFGALSLFYFFLTLPSLAGQESYFARNPLRLVRARPTREALLCSRSHVDDAHSLVDWVNVCN
jgi:hypothetical protein